MDQYLDKPLPSSPESERILLGAILLDNSLIYSVIRQLKAEDIYSPLHRHIYRAMEKVFYRQLESGQHVTLSVMEIGEELKKIGQLETLGGYATITNLTFGLPHFSNVDEYIQRIQDKATARNLIKTAEDIVNRCLAEEEEIKDLVSHAQAEIFKFNEFSHTDEFSSIHAVADEGVESLRHYVDSDTIRKLPQTGFIDLDNLLGGLDPEFIICGARPSIGKSTISWQIAENVAAAGGCVHYYSPEMSKEALMWRSISIRTGIPYNRIKIGSITRPEFERLEHEAWEFRKLNIQIYDVTNLNAFDIIAKSRQFIVENKTEPDLIIADYLQLMEPVARASDLRERVTNISKELVQVKKTFKKPLIAISSLSRPPKGIKVPPPQMTDLRESGQIDYDADQVWLLHRPGHYDKQADQTEAQLNIAKNRNGPTDTVNLFWHQEKHSFANAIRN